MEQGTIKRLTDKGFGFITPQNGNGQKDLFFHASGLDGDVRFEELREGQKVSYSTEQGPKGPRAASVKLA